MNDPWEPQDDPWEVQQAAPADDPWEVAPVEQPWYAKGWDTVKDLAGYMPATAITNKAIDFFADMDTVQPFTNNYGTSPLSQLPVEDLAAQNKARWAQEKQQEQYWNQVATQPTPFSSFSSFQQTPSVNEQKFQDWYAGYADKLGLNPNPDDPQHFYDYRKAYAAGATPDATGHWPSDFKTEGHPRMIVNGQLTKTPTSKVDIVDLYQELNPDRSSIDFINQQEQERQQGLTNDKDLFNLPYSMSEERLNGPIVEPGGKLTQALDIMAIPKQIVQGELISEPGSDFWDVARQSVRSNVGGREVLESWGGKELPKLSITNPDSIQAEFAALGADMAMDPLQIVPEAVGTKLFEPLRILAKGSIEVAGDAMAKVPGWVDFAKKVSKYAYRSPEERSVVDMLDLYRERLGFSDEDIIRDVVLGDTGVTRKLAYEVGEKNGIAPEFVDKTIRQYAEDRIGASQNFQPMVVASQPEGAANLEGKQVPDLMKGTLDLAKKPAQVAELPGYGKIPGIVMSEVDPVEVYKTIKEVQKNPLLADPRVILDAGTYEKWMDAIGVPKSESLGFSEGRMLPEQATPDGMFSRFGSNQKADFSLNQIPVVRQQATKGAVEGAITPEYSPYRAETFYTLDFDETGKSLYADPTIQRKMKQGGMTQFGGDVSVPAKISPVNPLIINGYEQSTGPIIYRYFPEFYGPEISKMRQSKIGSAKILTDLGVPKAEAMATVNAELKMGDRSIYLDRVANQLAKNEGFDSILSYVKTSDEGIQGELRMLDNFETQLKKGSLGTLTDEMMNIGNQQKNLVVKMPQQILDAVTAQQRSTIDTILKTRMIGDVDPQTQSEMTDWIYHMMTPEAKAEVVKVLGPKGGFKEWSPVHAGIVAKNKALSQLKIDEVNPIARIQGIDIGGHTIKVNKFFEDDLTAIEAFSRYKAAKLENNTQLWFDAARQFSRPMTKTLKEQGWRELAVVTNKDPRYAQIIPQLKGKGFKPETARMLDSVLDFNTNPESQIGFTKLLEKVRANWVSGTLYAFPSTMIKNGVGNVFNNWINGLDDPEWYEVMSKIQKSGGVGKVRLPGMDTYMDMGKLKAELNDMVIMGHGYPQEEVRAANAKFGGHPMVFDLPGAGKVLKKGEKAYRSIEDNARGALYLYKKYGEGLTPLQARAEVSKTLFDYVHGLSDFERKLRLYVPFYSWMRFNVPFQVNAIMNNPLKRPFVRLSEFVSFERDNQAARKVDEFHKTVLPEFVNQMGGVPVRMGEDGNPEYLLLGSWVPTMQLESLMSVNGAWNQALNMIAPYIKIPTEQAFNYDLFRKRVIESYPGETQKFMGEDVRRRLVHASRFFRFATELDSMTSGMTGTGEEFDPMAKDAVSKALRFIFGGASVKVNMDYGEQKRMAKIRETMNRLRSASKPKDIQALQEQLESLVEE